MKGSIYLGVWSITLLATILSLSFTISEGLRSIPDLSNGAYSRGSLREDKNHMISKKEGDKDLLMEFYPTGSSLPDCAHACGPCNPCKRVMVSFKCSIAESCPIVYRCMCKGKYYHVPSN